MWWRNLHFMPKLKFTKHFVNTWWFSSTPTRGHQVFWPVWSSAFPDKLQPPISRQNKALSSRTRGSGRENRRRERLRWRAFQEKQDSNYLTLYVEHRWAIRRQHIARVASSCPGWQGKSFLRLLVSPWGAGFQVSQEQSAADALTEGRKDVKSCIWPRAENRSL